MLSKFLDSLSTFSWELETGVVSAILFGEQPYPSEADYNEETE